MPKGDSFKILETQYEEYKRFFDSTQGWLFIKKSTNSVIIDPPINSPLEYVRIYFKTPTFDDITKDKAAKLVELEEIIPVKEQELSEAEEELKLHADGGWTEN